VVSLLGAALRERREHLGLGVCELARRAGVVPSYVSHIEAGRRIPGLRNLVALADVLRIDAAMLSAWAIADIRKDWGMP
jgi:transcriptional regulator with XRE-family HTH domain